MTIEARQELAKTRFHLIGHSFGCRVILSALQALTQDAATLGLARQMQAVFRVALIQAAADADSLTPGGLYDSVLSQVPNLRVLATISANDLALGKWYPAAQDLAHLFRDNIQAMGAVGPSGVGVDDRFPVANSPVPLAQGALNVADLTPLHQAHKAAYEKQTGGPNPWAGQHSDINLPEIYELLARFLGH